MVTLVKHILRETPTVVLPIPIRKECEHIIILNWPNAIAPCILFLFLYYYYYIFLFFVFWMTENWLHVSGEPSNWRITQAIRYKNVYTSACLKALKYCQISCIFYKDHGGNPCAQNTNTTLLIIFYPCVSVN